MKKAFTLAEVLITLSIIGVVAAITLSALINNTRNRELETGLKTAYSLLSQGLNQMSLDAGETIIPANYSDSNFYGEYKKYFKLAYDCGVLKPDQSLCMSRSSNSSEENNFNNDLTYKTYTGGTLCTNSFDDGQFVLYNGMLVMINNNLYAPSEPIYISVDVNGKKKRPNKLGYDLFTFQLMDSGKLLPMGADGTAYSEDEYCSKTLTSNVNGIACTNKAFYDKNYFKNLP